MPNYNLPASSDFFKGLVYQRMQDDLHLAKMAQRTVHRFDLSVTQQLIVQD